MIFFSSFRVRLYLRARARVRAADVRGHWERMQLRVWGTNLFGKRTDSIERRLRRGKIPETDQRVRESDGKEVL